MRVGCHMSLIRITAWTNSGRGIKLFVVASNSSTNAARLLRSLYLLSESLFQSIKSLSSDSKDANLSNTFESTALLLLKEEILRKKTPKEKALEKEIPKEKTLREKIWSKGELSKEEILEEKLLTDRCSAFFDPICH